MYFLTFALSLYLFSKKNYLLLFMCMCEHLYVCLCSTCMPGIQKVKKIWLDAPELELQAVVNPHVGAENPPGPS